ncbi:hypothetical protein GOP47_0028377 [Adiantum capillus-veneris]|nr:hypothetical protein GOP47_0028377 [Adiantum capillus-veneris]
MEHGGGGSRASNINVKQVELKLQNIDNTKDEEENATSKEAQELEYETEYALSRGYKPLSKR